MTCGWLLTVLTFLGLPNWVVLEHCLSPEQYRTTSVTLTKWSTENFPLYTAVNGTVYPNESSVSGIFRFIPASYWIPTSRGPCNNQSFNVTPDGTIRLAHEFLQLSSEKRHSLPDLSLWRDRSVLLLTINRLKFKQDGDVCPKTGVYPIEGLISESFLKNLTTPDQISQLPATGGPCHSEVTSPLHFLYPLATGVWITIYNLGSKPAQYKDEFQFVVTAAYRLDMGEFECPRGLFACDLPYDDLKQEPEPTPTHEWQVRLCLPLSLRCDGVRNCPNSGSDERNCANPSVAFQTIPEEQNHLSIWLNSYSLDVVRSVGRNPEVLFAGRTNYLILFLAICSVALLIIVLALVVLFVCIPRCRKRHRRTPEKSNVPAYEPIPGDISNGISNGSKPAPLYEPIPQAC